MARLRSLAIAGIAAVVLAVIVVAFVVLIARTAGDPAIVIENASSNPLGHIVCTLSADGIAWTERRDEVKPNEELRFSKST
jgi:hypothetical protein